MLADDPAHPASASHWVDTRLYFELGPYAAAGIPRSADGHRHWPVSEADWLGFLDREVTPRFPDGLSVQDVYGQWKGVHDAVPNRARSKVLLIDYPDTAANRSRILAIRSAWKQWTGEQSVLQVTIPAEVSF